MLSNELNIFVDCRLRQAKIGNDVLHRSAGFCCLLEDRDAKPGFGEKVCGGKPRWPGSYDSHRNAVSLHRIFIFEALKIFVVALFRRNSFEIANLHRIIVVPTSAFIHALVIANIAGDMRERILLDDHFKCVCIAFFLHKPHIFTHILMDGACDGTWGHVAIELFEFLLDLHGVDFSCSLCIVRVR